MYVSYNNINANKNDDNDINIIQNNESFVKIVNISNTISMLADTNNTAPEYVIFLLTVDEYKNKKNIKPI